MCSLMSPCYIHANMVGLESNESIFAPSANNTWNRNADKLRLLIIIKVINIIKNTCRQMPVTIAVTVADIIEICVLES